MIPTDAVMTTSTEKRVASLRLANMFSPVLNSLTDYGKLYTARGPSLSIYQTSLSRPMSHKVILTLLASVIAQHESPILAMPSRYNRPRIPLFANPRPRNSVANVSWKLAMGGLVCR